MANEVRPGAEPGSWNGNEHGVLVLHGFTGSPQSLRGLAEAIAGAGFTVELPRLPGHGTSIEDLETTGFADWLAAAEKTYVELAGRVRDVVVVGLSMGGTLAATLAATQPGVVGAIFVNPMITSLDEGSTTFLRSLAEGGQTRLEGIGSSIADPDAHEDAYTDTPLVPLLSLLDAVALLPDRLVDVRCPVLIFTSPDDPVVPPVSSDVLAERVSGPVERVATERSLHVATLDYDRDEIERRSVEFVRQITG